MKTRYALLTLLELERKVSGEKQTVLFNFFDPKALPFLISHDIDLNAVDNHGEDPIRSWHRRHMSVPDFEKALQEARQQAATNE